jgi:hypothetical protein
MGLRVCCGSCCLIGDETKVFVVDNTEKESDNSSEGERGSGELFAVLLV